MPVTARVPKAGKRSFGSYMARYWPLYTMMALPMAFCLLFKYWPMTGLVMAFKNFKMMRGIWGSDWNGFKNFEYLFSRSESVTVILQTLKLNLMDLLFGFTMPIILSIMLNEVRSKSFKRITQTVIYLPHFLSWVIIASLFIMLLRTETGMVNIIAAGLGGSKIPYLEEEREFMRPLPTMPYEPAVWSPELRVGNDYLVSDGVNRYSVPFDLIGEKVVLRLTRNAVEVFFKGTRVAMHLRNDTPQREPVVKEEHMPPEHRKYLSYNTNDFTQWGESIGGSAASVVRYFLTSEKEPEQGFKACASMTRLAERYGNKRLENACKRLLAFTQTPSIRTLNTILKNGQDKAEAPVEETKSDTQYGITRGAAYFRKGGASK